MFGGTSEGRSLVEWLSARGTCEVVACSATEYGGELVAGLPRVEALVGPLDAAAKERLVGAHDFACIVDATHPYATHVSESVAALASSHGIPRLRLVREVGSSLAEGDFGEGVTVVESVAEAAQLVARRPGNILLTTGTKDLAAFVQAVPDFAERVFVRVLPIAESVARARELGFPASRVVAMQGPFSAGFNGALMRELGIRVMVTKASGAAGGFGEKLEAAARCGAEAVVIGRPTVEEGLSLEGVERELEARYGA